jgi:autotransporter strand-loop-strand O-heptosyltransferase
MNEIANAEFFIGLGSGLSWLAWALGKKVVMIAGHSAPDSEFQEDNYRIYNPNICCNCWGDPSAKWDAFNWTWCPRHEGALRQFECTSKITPKMVMEQVEVLLADLAAGKTKN